MGKNYSPAKSGTATIIALKKIKELIFSGELSSDANYLETELADLLGISRTPVREAALVLEGQGLLKVQPRKGIRINSVSAEDMREIYEVLTELEGLAAKRAAQRKYSKAELTVLGQAMQGMNIALSKNNREAWAVADESFHAELVRLGGNSRVISIVNTYNDQVRRARLFTLNLRPMPIQSNEDHQALYNAILNGEASKAERIHRNHRKNASKILTELLATVGLKRV